MENSLEISYTYRGRHISALYGSSSWHHFKLNKSHYFKYKLGYVPLGFEGRPDSISNLFLDTPSFWWVVLEANNISDPFEGLVNGTRIRIPIHGI